MASLTEVAGVTRKIIIGLGIFVVLFFVGTMSLRIGREAWRVLHPEKPPPPTVGFGRLPLPRFPTRSLPQYSYKMEVPAGAEVAFGDRAKVFFSSASRSNLLALERAKKQATSLGFVFEPTEVSETVFRWTKTSPLQSVLELDINTGNFTMDVSWETDPGFLQNKLLLDENQAVNEARNYLSRAGMLARDVEEGVSETTFLMYRGGEFIKVNSLSEAHFIRVDLFRAPIKDPTPELADKNPRETARIFTKDPEKGVARILYSGSRGQGERIVAAEMKYTEIMYEEAETYPVISPSQAWQFLTTGSGYVAVPVENGTEVVVRRMELGYYDQLEEKAYVLPMYVFYGDGGFVGYVPAIAPEWYAPDEASSAGQ